METQTSQTPLYELLITKCWNPSCREVATCRDKSGWEWCDQHLDQEKIGGLHALDIRLDIDYYQKRIIKILERKVISNQLTQ